MPTYKTPGVYVEEIATLPPSVAEVATAIPAFLGNTEKQPSPPNRPIRLTSMVDYAQHFGGPNPTAFTVKMDSGELKATPTLASSNTPKCLMYYSLKMYFDNGGGPCYVVSVGNYTTNGAAEHFIDGLKELEKEDEPTLILLTDAVNLGD